MHKPGFGCAQKINACHRTIVGSTQTFRAMHKAAVGSTQALKYCTTRPEGLTTVRFFVTMGTFLCTMA
jgi:hypothetical protein